VPPALQGTRSSSRIQFYVDEAPHDRLRPDATLYLFEKPGVLPIAVEYVLVAYSILAVSIAAVLKGRVGRERDASRRASLLLVGWAVGEGAALIGAVIFYITGQAQWYGLGILTMVCSFAMLSSGVASASAGGVDARG